MAKPIEPTPILKGEDVIEFYKELEKEAKNPNPKRIAFIKSCDEIYSKIVRKF